MLSASHDELEKRHVPRFYIDERVGCIAVRDSLKDNPNDQGLHPQMPGVVKFWWGESKTRVCPMCGHVSSDGWRLSEADRLAAQHACDNLNSGLEV